LMQNHQQACASHNSAEWFALLGLNRQSRDFVRFGKPQDDDGS
jgi:hypothetical protein